MFIQDCKSQRARRYRLSSFKLHVGYLVVTPFYRPVSETHILHGRQFHRVPLVYLTFFIKTCNPEIPQTLPKAPTPKSLNSPPSRLQCSVNGNQLPLTTTCLHHSLFHPSLSFCATPLASAISLSLHNRPKSKTTCAIQNLQLHSQALFCFCSLHPITPFELRYAPFSNVWKIKLQTTCTLVMRLTTLSCSSFCNTAFPHLYIPTKPKILAKIRTSDISAESAFNRAAVISNGEAGIVDISTKTVAFGGNSTALFNILRICVRTACNEMEESKEEVRSVV